MDTMTRQRFSDATPERIEFGDHDMRRGFVRPDSVLRRLEAAKCGFGLRRLDLQVTMLLERQYPPEIGSLLLARVTQLGEQDRIELVDGRLARLYVDDEILVSCGHLDIPGGNGVRVPERMQRCALATAAGLAGEMETVNGRPTLLQPIGMLGDISGAPLNLSRFALPAVDRFAASVPVFAILATDMHSGASTTSADVIRSLTRSGLRVAAAKITGPGGGVDYWQMLDAGAVAARDFGDCGLPSTFRIPIDALRRMFHSLLSDLERSSPDAIVIELSIGTCRREAEAMLVAPWFAQNVDRMLIDASDGVSLHRCIGAARELGLRIAAVAGSIVDGPSAAHKTIGNPGVRALSQRELQDPSVLTPLFFS